MAALTVACYQAGNNRNYSRLAAAMHKGVQASGDESTLVPWARFRNARAGFSYGWKKNALLRQHARFFYADLGYWDRKNYWRMASNDWSPVRGMRHGMPSDRLEALGVQVLPEHGGDFVLLLGASDKAMTEHGWKYMEWETKTCRLLQNMGAKVRFRAKPTDRQAKAIPGVDNVTHYPLPDLLAQASLVVAHHSNACVEAVAAGCAVNCHMGVAQIRSVPLETWRDPPRVPGQTQFLADVAYLQWTLDEMKSGAAWQHMREGVLQ